MGVGATASRAAASVIDVTADAPHDAWNGYVASRPEASIYHLAEWSGIIARVFGHPTRYLAARDHGKIVGVLPLVLFNTPMFGRFAASMPFVNYGGVVADTERARDALLAAAIGEAGASRASYLELRHDVRLFPELPVQAHKVAMVLPLQKTADEQWHVLDRKIRNQIRKAEKSDLTVRCGGEELVGPFYQVLSRNMRDLGSPVHSPRFFADVVTTLADRARVFVVYLGPVPVAASIVLWRSGRLESPWASAVRDFNALCPNMLLYWEMLKFAIEQRCTSFDFGRSTPDEGTYRFKSQWGAQPRPLYWEYWLGPNGRLPDRSPKNPRFSKAISLWSRLPVAVANAIGPSIVRNIP